MLRVSGDGVAPRSVAGLRPAFGDLLARGSGLRLALGLLLADPSGDADDVVGRGVAERLGATVAFGDDVARSSR
ncbi:MAG: hypothetical protein JWO60_128, partial [Frankiales bacterium]|nr:hypothetical protein [Frankiales bacterium]